MLMMKGFTPTAAVLVAASIWLAAGNGIEPNLNTLSGQTRNYNKNGLDKVAVHFRDDPNCEGCGYKKSVCTVHMSKM
jgi:hypothetical protein